MGQEGDCLDFELAESPEFRELQLKAVANKLSAELIKAQGNGRNV